MRLSSRAEARSRPNGFSTMTRALLGQPGATESLDHRREQRRRNGEVMRRAARTAECPLESLERAGVAVITIDVVQ